MISIRFLCAASVPDLGRRFIADHLAVLDFAHAAFVDQQVGVADHLGEGEEGLGDGDVAPDRLRDLIAAARLLGDQPVDLLLAPLVLGEAVVDQGDVVDDRLAVAGEDELGRHLPGLAHRLDVGDERLRCVPRSRRAGGRSAGWRRCGRSGGRRRSGSAARRPRRPCRRGCGPGRCRASQGAVAEARSPRRPRAAWSRSTVRAPAAEAARDALQRDGDLLGDAVAQHQLDREAVLAPRRPRRSWRAARRRPRAPRPRRRSARR